LGGLAAAHQPVIWGLCSEEPVLPITLSPPLVVIATSPSITATHALS